MDKRNFIVFINPISGTDNKGKVRNIVVKKLQEHSLNYQVLPTEKSGNYHFLSDVITAEKITDIIICGGDGSVNSIASYIMGTAVQIGIVPMGSGNGLAFAAGIPKNPAKAMEVILAGKAKKIDAFMINNRFSCMLCGLGFDAQVAHEFAKQPSRGLATYFRETVKHFFKANTYPFTIHTNGTILKTDAYFISIANSNQFGNNFMIAPKASLMDGLLDIVVVNKTGKFNLLLKIMQQVRNGKIVKADDPQQTVHYFQTKKMSIFNPQKAPLHIDGEVSKTSDHFDIEILPAAFSLIHPF